MTKIKFFKGFLSDKHVASVIPSSSFTVKKICNKINFKKKNVIVEYGPGNGVFSKFILKKMNPQSKLILIERNKDFVLMLNKIKDPRIFIFNDSAEKVKIILEKCNEKKSDYIISGIPFSLLGKKKKKEIIKNTKDVLNKKGKFLVYQFSGHVKKYLKQYFKVVNFDFEILNIPPLLIFEASN